MSDAPPGYNEAVGGPAGSGSQQQAPSYDAGAHAPTSAGDEKAQVAAHLARQDGAAGGSSKEEKRLKIWFAPSYNAVITAADEATPIYNIIDSRAPDEQKQQQLSAEAQRHYDVYVAKSKREGRALPTEEQNRQLLQRREADDNSGGDISFVQQINRERAAPYSSGAIPHLAEYWTQQVRRGGDRHAPVIALLKRHISTKSDVSIEVNGYKTGIRQHSGFPHRKYTFDWHGVTYTWKRTHSAPATSKLDSGSYVCKDPEGEVVAWTTSDDDRCDGSLLIEEAALQRDMLDVIVITGFVMRDLDDEKRGPSYLRYGTRYGYGYGPYGSRYAGGFGFVPIFPATPLFLL